MNSDLIREGAKVSSSVVEGLKTQPLSLALVVMNVVFIIFVAWLAYTINARTESQYKVKDEQNALLLTKLDQIADVRTEVRGIAERLISNTTILKGLSDAIERLTRVEEDHEKRLRDLERRQGP
jgi:hypothetical protein